MNELENLDAIKERMNVTYTQAKEALEACEGNVVEALVYLEKKGFTAEFPLDDETWEEEREPIWDKEKTDNFVRGVVEQAKSIIQEGNVTKIRLISQEKTLIEIPATVGVVGLGIVLFSPLLFVISAIGAAAVVIKEMAFEIEKADGTIERRNLKFPNLGSKKGDDDACGCCCDDDCGTGEQSADCEAQEACCCDDDCETGGQSTDCEDPEACCCEDCKE